LLSGEQQRSIISFRKKEKNKYILMLFSLYVLKDVS